MRTPVGWPGRHPSAPAADRFAPVAGKDYPRNPMQTVPGAQVELGKPRASCSFSWDNSYGQATRDVDDFSASRYKVSNGEFLEFVKDGGYHDKQYWSAEGWGWRVFRNVKWPTFWTSVGPAGKHDYRLRTTFEVLPMPWSWPAEVNLHEARAFCNWRSARDGTPYKLQTEGQSIRLRGDATTATGGCDAAPTDPVMVSRGDEIATKHGLNLNLAYSTPWPVDSSHGGVDGVHPNPHSHPNPQPNPHPNLNR